MTTTIVPVLLNRFSGIPPDGILFDLEQPYGDRKRVKLVTLEYVKDMQDVRKQLAVMNCKIVSGEWLRLFMNLYSKCGKEPIAADIGERLENMAYPQCAYRFLVITPSVDGHWYLAYPWSDISRKDWRWLVEEI
jgi:hypothetical protein